MPKRSPKPSSNANEIDSIQLDSAVDANPKPIDSDGTDINKDKSPVKGRFLTTMLKKIQEEMPDDGSNVIFWIIQCIVRVFFQVMPECLIETFVNSMEDIIITGVIVCIGHFLGTFTPTYNRTLRESFGTFWWIYVIVYGHSLYRHLLAKTTVRRERENIRLLSACILSLYGAYVLSVVLKRREKGILVDTVKMLWTTLIERI